MNDRQIYLHLTGLAEELTRLSTEAESLVGEAALQMGAKTLSATAQAIYDHCLSGDEGVH